MATYLSSMRNLLLSFRTLAEPIAQRICSRELVVIIKLDKVTPLRWMR